MSAQLTTPGLLKLNIFWNKDYGVIISAYDVTKKSCGHVTKFDNSGIYAREVIHNFNFIRIWPEKKNFWEVILAQVHLFGTGTRLGIDILQQCGKRIKTKNQKVSGANFSFWRSYSGKTGNGLFCAPPHFFPQLS